MHTFIPKELYRDRQTYIYIYIERERERERERGERDRQTDIEREGGSTHRRQYLDRTKNISQC